MDPVTTAIRAAVAPGAKSAAGTVAKEAIVDSCESLKTLLKEKFGDSNQTSKAVHDLKPESKSQGRASSWLRKSKKRKLLRVQL